MHIQSAIYDRYHPVDMKFSSCFSCFFLLDTKYPGWLADWLASTSCTIRTLFYCGSGFGKGC